MEKIKKQMKKHNKKSEKNAQFSRFFSKLLLTIILTLISLITLKKSKDMQSQFYHHVYEKNISFATINSWYKNKFGSSIPFEDMFQKKTQDVFQEKLNYQNSKAYKDGVKLTVDQGYLVPIIESGMVVYIGQKEGYGKTVIIQQMDGTDVWYGNIQTESVKLYDYVEKGKLLGEVKDQTLYLVFKKDGKALSYDQYI